MSEDTLGKMTSFGNADGGDSQDRKLAQTTYTGDVIKETQAEDATKDNPIKRLIACRPILAFILRHTMSEFETATQEEVEQCIVGDIEVGRIVVNPGLTNRVQLGQQEDAIKGEGIVYYDVRATIMTPVDETEQEVKILIDVEGQRDDTPGYDLSMRAIFYCCRMISSQLGVEFTNKKDDLVKYNGIKKVYSIFICPNAAKKRAGSVEEYKLGRDIIIGWNNDSPRYDVMRALIIYINTNYTVDGNESELIKMLTDLFSGKMSGAEKLEKLQDDYGIRTTMDVMEEVKAMDGWAEMLKEEFREMGREEEIISLVSDGDLSIEKGSKRLGISVSEFKIKMELYKTRHATI